MKKEDKEAEQKKAYKKYCRARQKKAIKSISWNYDIVDICYLYKNQCHIEIPQAIHIVNDAVLGSDEPITIPRGEAIYSSICSVISDGPKKVGALYLFKKDDELYFGWSYCSDYDQFNRIEARMVAEKRAKVYTIKNLKTIKGNFPPRAYSQEILEWFQEAVTTYLTDEESKKEEDE